MVNQFISRSVDSTDSGTEEDIRLVNFSIKNYWTVPLSPFNVTISGFDLRDFKAESSDLDKLGLSGLDCCKVEAELYLTGSLMV
ncbi:hypothetical protein Trydic_g6586 [Trypoxylus dichotomus]